MIEYKLTEGDRLAMARCLSGEGGEVLIDIVTDQIVTNSTISAEERAGAGLVLSLMRSLKNQTGQKVTKP